MNAIGHSERETQNRVIALFRDEFHYRFLGDWSDRAGNSNIEKGMLEERLKPVCVSQCGRRRFSLFGGNSVNLRG